MHGGNLTRGVIGANSCAVPGTGPPASAAWRASGFARLHTMPPEPPFSDSVSTKPAADAQVTAPSAPPELREESLLRAARLLQLLLKLDSEPRAQAAASTSGRTTPRVQLLTLPVIENTADWVSCADVSKDASPESYTRMVRDSGGVAFAIVPIVRRVGSLAKRW